MHDRPQSNTYCTLTPCVSLFQTHWPYECGHTALNYENQQWSIDYSSFTCCEKCKFPAFTICLLSKPWLWCNREALHCISKCICNNGGKRGPHQGDKDDTDDKDDTESLRKSQVKPGQCSDTIKRTGRSYCIQRSCIPFNI